MHATGVILGASSFLIIGLFHPVVVKAEYHFGARVWPFFLVLGLASVIWSLFIPEVLWSGLFSIFGFCSLWTIRELFEQEERVRKGWFPRNPSRTSD